MKILNFKILRQTILLLLLLLVSTFEVSLTNLPSGCQSSSRVKSVHLIEKRSSKLLQVKEMNNSTQVMLGTDFSQDSILYMFTLPPSARPKGPKKQNSGHFLLYNPHTKRFICRQITRNKKERRNFVTEEYPNINRCSFSESIDSKVSGYVQYRVGKTFLLNKKHFFLRIMNGCTCPKVKFYNDMIALKKKRKRGRHQHLQKILEGFIINPEDEAFCNN